jgi:hypothetical protein
MIPQNVASEQGEMVSVVQFEDVAVAKIFRPVHGRDTAGLGR